MQLDAAQLPLFESSDTVLVDDERGRVSYTPGLVSQATAHQWFAQLRLDVQWRTERRTMYERDVDVPRLIAHFRLGPSPVTIPAALLDAARHVTDRVGAPFNSVRVNLYRDGRDSVAPHNDHLSEIRRGFPIALLSLGATRRMTIRAKAEPRRVFHVDLEAGSLLVMETMPRSCTTPMRCRRRRTRQGNASAWRLGSSERKTRRPTVRAATSIADAMPRQA